MQVHQRRAYRIAVYLDLPVERDNNHLVYKIGASHPLKESMDIAEHSDKAKPVYTIAEIAALWQHCGVSYTPTRVVARLEESGIFIYNRENKGLVYLADLARLTEYQIYPVI